MMNKKGDVPRLIVWVLILLILALFILALFYFKAIQLIKRLIGV